MTTLKNVAEVSFNNIFLTILALYIQVEFFSNICYNNLIYFTKINQIFKSNQLASNLNNARGVDTVFLTILFLTFLTLKGNNITLFGFILILVIYIFSLLRVLDFLKDSFSSNSSIHIVIVSLVVFFYFLFFLKSFLTLFFFVELYGVIYYFFFITNYSLTSQTILKYKNGILLLLWNNFLTTFFLGLGCFYISKHFGTTNFEELATIANNSLYVYVFLCGLCWKLGLPVFHFFKIEVYKFLLKENVFIFSILTTLVNVIILYICLTQTFIFNTIYLYNLCLLIIVGAVVIVLVNLKLTNILHFFAISSVLTLATILALFLI